MSTFRRFETAERVDLGAEEIVKKLEARKFVPLDKAVEETERFGWITLEHLFDTRFDIEKVFHDPYVTFALRIDKRKIPQNLVRAHMKIEEQAFVNATGKKCGPAKRREIRDQVRLKLIDKVLPSAASYQVIWNPNEGIVWFGNTGEKTCEAFIQQFEDTFGVTLIAQGPRHLGLRITGGDADAIDRAASTSFSKQAPAYQLAVAQ
ncbi:MAG TPA: recombination-associated protein RdgC [Planctomycetota bacterium]|nr:recombination-associated protein RdgC [Planctomycetota bacterium]